MDAPAASMTRPVRIVLVGPTSVPYETIAGEVEADLARLARPGVELSYRCTGAGPRSIRSVDDVAVAAPHVVAAVVEAAREGFDAVIVDCTDDPGVAEARRMVSIPVLGPGEAVRDRIAQVPDPVVAVSGHELRALDLPALRAQVAGAATVVLGGTGWSHVADELRAAGHVVVDPLPTALDACLAALDRQ